MNGVEMLWRNMPVRKGSLHPSPRIVDTGYVAGAPGAPRIMHLGSYGIQMILYFTLSEAL